MSGDKTKIVNMPEVYIPAHAGLLRKPITISNMFKSDSQLFITSRAENTLDSHPIIDFTFLGYGAESKSIPASEFLDRVRIQIADMPYSKIQGIKVKEVRKNGDIYNHTFTFNIHRPDENGYIFFEPVYDSKGRLDINESLQIDDADGINSVMIRVYKFRPSLKRNIYFSITVDNKKIVGGWGGRSSLLLASKDQFEKHSFKTQTNAKAIKDMSIFVEVTDNKKHSMSKHITFNKSVLEKK